jgi:hypothetical protein
MDDYTPVPVVNPLTGETFNVFNLNPAKLRDVDRLDTNAGSGRKQIYNGVDVTFDARLAGGATLFGGWVTERTLRVICDEPDDPNFLLFCDDRDNDIPYRPQLKLAGTYPLPWWGVQVSASFQSLAGRPIGGYYTNLTNIGNKIIGPGNIDAGSPIGTQWALTRATRYPSNCKGPCTPGALVIPNLTESSVTVPLVAPNTEFLPRLNQLDVSVGKWFGVGRTRVHGQIDFFNLLNASTIIEYRSTNFATPAYQQPSSVLQARLIRVGTRIAW